MVLRTRPGPRRRHLGDRPPRGSVHQHRHSTRRRRRHPAAGRWRGRRSRTDTADLSGSLPPRPEQRKTCAPSESSSSTHNYTLLSQERLRKPQMRRMGRRPTGPPEHITAITRYSTPAGSGGETSTLAGSPSSRRGAAGEPSGTAGICRRGCASPPDGPATGLGPSSGRSRCPTKSCMSVGRACSRAGRPTWK